MTGPLGHLGRYPDNAIQETYSIRFRRSVLHFGVAGGCFPSEQEAIARTLGADSHSNEKSPTQNREGPTQKYSVALEASNYLPLILPSLLAIERRNRMAKSYILGTPNTFVN